MNSTGKGVFLTTGIALLSMGITLVEKNVWTALMLFVVGAGLIFAREFLKE